MSEKLFVMGVAVVAFAVSALHMDLAGWWKCRHEMGKDIAYDGVSSLQKSRGNRNSAVFSFVFGVAVIGLSTWIGG